ncbi:phage tail tape measure protein [Dickeya sp. ws52]|uniref:phage tail tape measure protein n=1 Tax=Dickeya sp. ws52 TaxID=2576377 RepID=UPI00117CD53A|nr:phage tail tape measure protein [Dickeya sp. ws52]TYL43766.1 phage tail tape measure protein [Dickeya sp. ws52]
MNSQFSVGVIIGGTISGAFRSAMSGTRRTLDSLGDVSRQLTERQNTLSRAMERYGEIGSRSAQRINADLLRVGRTMEQLQQQQKRLQSASATSDAARSNRMALYGQGVETYAMARTGYEMVSPAIEKSTLFSDKMIDMQITAKYTDQTRDGLASKLRGWSKEYNQTQEDMQAAMGELISNNIDSVQDIEKYMPSIGRAATATRTSGKDWANVAKAWQLSLSGTAEKFGAVQNIIAYAGDQGSFEIGDQVKWIQELAPEIASMLKGERAVAELGASLQIAKIGSNSSDIAGNNFKNFLTKIFAKETRTSFASVGIDLESSIMSHQAAGLSPIEGMMNIIELYLKKKSPEALEGFKKAMKLKDDKARDEALTSLAEQYNLGDLFADMQVMAFVRPMLANMDRFRHIRDGALKAAKDDALAKSYETRMRSPMEQIKRLSIATNDLAISIGDQLTPSFISGVQATVRWVDGVNQWVKANASMVNKIAGIATGILAFKAASIGARLGLNLLLSPIVDTYKGLVLLHSRWTLLRAAFGQGGRARQWVSLFGNLAKGAVNLGRILGGTLLRGIGLVGRSIITMGRLLMLNPIGIAITLIAGAAYLVYRYWEPISGWFKQRWVDIKTAFSGGISGVTSLILDWSPVGLFYRVFAGVMKYFGVDIPSKFSEFGGNIINGFVSGIRNKWEEAKASVGELGDNIKGWFAEKLGIHSPSRVFMGFGDNIAQGAAIGISRSTPLAATAGLRLAKTLEPELPKLPSFSQSELPTTARRSSSGRGNDASSGSGAGEIHIINNIYIDGKQQTATAELSSALGDITREVERALERILSSRRRIAYD